MTELGVLLERKAVHTERFARNHLLALAQTNGIRSSRVDDAIDTVGCLRDVAGKRVGGFSLGMGQRLGVPSALLGNPQAVVLDEPVNGLDPEGVRCMRTMLKDLAADGHAVFVSSHLMSEMTQTATRLVVVGRGRLIADTTGDEFVAVASNHSVTAPAAVGLGDVRLFALTAGLLGWTSWVTVLYGEMTAFVVAGLLAAAMVVLAPRRAIRGRQVPLGPAIIIGSLLICWL